MSTTALVASYLAAIVVANLAVAQWGTAAVVPVSFALVGLDLTTRDALHERWAGRGLWVRMLALIAAGGALSWLLNADAGRIAVASTAAFVTAGAVDTVVYTALARRSRRVRVNGSNLLAAGVDTLAFQAIAFGALMPALVLAQWAAKVLGGALWMEVASALHLWRGASRAAGDADS